MRTILFLSLLIVVGFLKAQDIETPKSLNNTAINQEILNQPINQKQG